MSIIYLNGEFTKGNKPLISHRDCGFTTGIGIFDSMLCIDGKPQHITEHFERITYDTKTVIGLTLPLSFKAFERAIQTLIEENNLTLSHARIRTTVTGGEVSAPLAPAITPTILIDVAPCTPPPSTPVTCAVITDYPRIAGCALENCKRLDYTRSYAARRKAETMNAEEAILTNTDGNIACAATSNIFIEENGLLITPPLNDGVLAGVTRRKILDNSLSLQGEGWGEGFTVKEDSISPDRLNNADKIYLTNSFIGLRAVILT